jgi:hypothetical protein
LNIGTFDPGHPGTLKEELMRYVAIAVVAGLALSGCSVITPPPMMMRHEAVVQGGPGTMSAAVIGGMGGGVFVDTAAGGLARFERQETDKFRWGVSGGAGARTEHEGKRPGTLYFGRAHGIHRPFDWMQVQVGLGGGYADSGLGYATLDTGATFGYTFWNRLRPYGGPVFALSVPVAQGKPLGGENEELPRTTLFAGVTGGVGVRLVDTLEASVEGTGLYGFSGYSDATLFSVTGGLRYSF